MDVQDHRYREMFALAGSGMALLSADGAWRRVNPAMARLLQASAEQLQGRAVHAGRFVDDAGRLQAMLAGDTDAGTGDDGLLLADAHDPRRHWRIRLSPLRANAPDALRLLQLDDASDEVQLRRTVEAMSAQQETLAFGISHDLRAPLRGIAGFAARLSESHALPDEAVGDLERIRAAARRAESLIDDLLELSRAARQPFRDEAVDISLLGEWTASELRDADPARNATIDVVADLHARGDEHWLKILLGKLLSNAWRFSAQREHARIAVDGAASGGRLELAIRDNGSGFDMRYAGKLFQPFQRLHRAEDGAGNGLGLAIARQIVDRHGGRLWAESRPDEGSTFYVELPAVAGRTP